MSTSLINLTSCLQSFAVVQPLRQHRADIGSWVNMWMYHMGHTLTHDLYSKKISITFIITFFTVKHKLLHETKTNISVVFFGTLRCVIDKYLFILNCVQVLV